MASVKGVYKTKADDGDAIGQGIVSGRVIRAYDEYEASALASGSDISVGDALPEGATIVDVVVMADALGASVTLKVGDSTDDDRYISSTAFNTANKRQNANAIDGVGYQVTGTTNQVVVTTGGAAATGTIKVWVLYTVD